MLRTRVKICGITSRADAEAAIEAGADALGFVLWGGSPRAVAPDDLARLTADLPPFVTRVGVFVDRDGPQIEACLREGGLHVAQLHGRQDREFCERLSVNWYRAFQVAADSEPLPVATAIMGFECGTFMLDTHSPDAPGGTGRAFDWGVAAKISMHVALRGSPRLILAGGLTPDNVGQAIRAVRPWAVDVSSGVEREPGRKDPDRIKAFIEAVREVQ